MSDTTLVEALLFVIFGLSFSLPGTLDLRYALRSDKMKKTWGQVVRSMIERGRIDGNPGSTLLLRVEYEYQIGNNRLHAHELISCDTIQAMDGSNATLALQQYRPQQKVPVMYQPEDPTNAHLARSTFANHFFRIFFGLLFIALGTLVAMVA